MVSCSFVVEIMIYLMQAVILYYSSTFPTTWVHPGQCINCCRLVWIDCLHVDVVFEIGLWACRVHSPGVCDILYVTRQMTMKSERVVDFESHGGIEMHAF